MSFIVYTGLFLLLCIPYCLGDYTITGSSTYAVKGQSFLFTCNTDTDSPPVLQFIRGSTQICILLKCVPGTGIMDPRATCGCYNANSANSFYANITDINTEDETNWTCKSNDASTQSSPLNLPVYFGPKNISFNPSGDTLQVIEGTRGNVECIADCKPNCNYKWSKGNTVVSNNKTLSIINRDEAGSYTCRVQHPNISPNSQTKALIVTVIYGPDSLTLSTSPNLVLTEGTDQTVSCDADCYPTCTFSWYRDTVEVNKNNNLVFTSINQAQTGNYTCQANNSVSTLTKSSVLSVVVYYSPSIRSLSSTAVGNITTEGSEVTFTCNADSRPLSTITWSTSDRPSIDTGNTMILDKLRCQDTNVYSCTANNNVGNSAVSSIPLYVNCTPTETKNLTKEVINRVGQRVTLEVNVFAYPEPTFTWRKNSTGVKLQDTTENTSINSYKSSVEINLQQTSFGYYIINVENDVGKTTYSIKVTDGDPPTPPIDPVPINIAAIAGGIAAAVVVITIVVVIVIVIKRRGKGKEDSNTSRSPTPDKHDIELSDNNLYAGSDHIFGNANVNPIVNGKEVVLSENNVYEGSDAYFNKQTDQAAGGNDNGIFNSAKPEPVYGVVNKPKRTQPNKKKEDKKPPKPNKPPPVPGESNNNENIYQNTGPKKKPATAKKPGARGDGLTYIQVDFPNKQPTTKIHGEKEDESQYAAIDYGKKGKLPPPDPNEIDSD